MHIQDSSDINENPKIFGDKSQLILCEFCNQKTNSLVKPQPTYLSYMLCLLVLLLFGFWFSIILIPCVLLLTQTLYHICPLCTHELGTNNRIFNHFYLQDKIMTFKIAEFGVILTRKIMLGALLSVIITGIIIYRINNLHHHHSIGKISFTFDTWGQFLDKCHPNKLPGNSAFCVENYLDKSVYNWEGYVIRLIDNRENFARFLTHAVEILIKMEPSESNPDIYMTFDSEEADELGLIFNNLDRGKKVRFNGSIKNFGDDGKGRHLHGFGLIELEGRVEIEENWVGKGRYGGSSLRGKKSDGKTV